MFVLLIISLAFTSGSVLKHELNQPWKDKAAPVVHSNGRFKRYIDLGEKESNIKQVACDLPDGKPGICKPMQQCVTDGDTKNNFQKFFNTLCVIDSSKIGTCCADRSQEFDGLAGDLPATADKEEDTEVLLKIDRAENRGCGVSTRPSAQLFSGTEEGRVWPWMATITIVGIKHFCGGALITDRHILTAAHCFPNFAPEDLVVRLGEYDLKRKNETRTFTLNVIEKIEHELFDKMNRWNDISILKLHRPVVFNTYVWPICLPPPGLELTNETAILTGWGTVKFGGPISNVLKEVDMPIWELEKCKESIAEAVFDENYCVGAYTGGRDACQYDSGSPLMYQMPSGRWAVIGVVSWGVRCGEPNHPGLYTRTDKYLKWIADHVQF